MTQFPELFAALGASFDDREVRVRTQAGRQLSYITARTAMNRLDTILGPENWWDEYLPGESSVICKLTVRLPDGTTLTKQDAGGYAGMADQGDDDKSGFSDAFKRAAVKFGVGRYLYRDGVATFATGRGVGAESTSTAPGLASESTRSSEGTDEAHGAGATLVVASPAGSKVGNGPGTAPRTGRALFAWTKEQEQRHDVGLLRYLNGWAKLQDYPGRMVDWDHDQVKFAYSEACRKLQSFAKAPAEEYEEALAN